MEKMKMETPNLTDQNIEKIAELFPNCITEGKDENGQLKKLINFDMLKQMLSDSVTEGKEVYEFTWPGKKEAIIEANSPIRKTLRPCKEESKSWDTTENLYIEGDNLEVLKLLQESYLGKVKMIYIDPPYNTGNDFIYRDTFESSKSEFEEMNNVRSDDGVQLIRNLETNGRFHSNWCSMIYPRLHLSRNLLTEDGVIFISIDDNEQENLRKICDEVFGEHNFVAQLIWERAYAPKNDAKHVSNSHDYILMYAKNLDVFKIGRLPRTEEANARYSNPDNDPRGPWKSSDLSVKTYSAASDYPITLPSGRVVEPPAGRCWSLSKNKFLERLQDNRIWFGVNGDSVPSMKRFLSELKFDGMAPTSIMFYKDVGHSQEGAKEVSALLGGGYFDGPKPVRLLKRLLTLANLKEDSIVLDFFSGSASIAQAVMEVNYESDKHIQYVLVQIPEPIDPKSKAYEAGYRTICDIGIDRIKKAENKIYKEDTLFESKAPGFRVFKVDSSNMNDVYYAPDDYNQGFLDHLESNIKEDRTSLDLLFGCLLDWGLPLSLPYTSEEIDGFTVHNYNDGDLIACFDENISDSVIKEIAKRKPLRAVFRDSSFQDSPSKINVSEIFKVLSVDENNKPVTQVKVI
ncbi:site-specific DNA-methyltransferase [Ileibacterium valens]|uniref:site-specific DNA-methyltransferase n=1 Tax=Ileibacterium valens TaxID=1862668 RepID=UPI000968C2EB|nr:site-specific DNA-methyltransferase [Ileibacterium valens]OLU37269.1 site-specific DNA-methyltransferase [Erysipelotrichaceae bacterium NYU-BL-F16]OLU41067.1 site-specific DNA-methyltransferase [Erysipelotrichaceae bacterium NYU-BL-E8]